MFTFRTRGKLLDRLRLRLVDASCSTCLPAIKKELEKIEGIEWVGTNPILEAIFVDYDPQLIRREQVLSAIKRSGYTATQAAT